MINRLVTWNMYERYFRFENQIHSEKRKCYPKVVDENKVFLIQTDILVYYMAIPDESAKLVNDGFLAESINVIFELVKTGRLGKRKTFIFRPHITDNLNNELRSRLENLQLLMPDYLFYDLLERLMFNGKTEWSELSSCIIIENLDINDIKYASLFSKETKYNFNTDQFKINRIVDPSTDANIEKYYGINIKKFENHTDLVDLIRSILFRGNALYEIVLNHNDEIIGYLLLGTEYWFNSGLSFQITLSENFDNRNFKKEIILGTANYLAENSTAKILKPAQKEDMGYVFVKTEYQLLADYEWDVKYKILLVNKIESNLKLELKNIEPSFLSVV